MTGSIALDVVIGLVFIYLLYSLFATVIMEIINTLLGLRARNLRYALRRMLMDEKQNEIRTENGQVESGAEAISVLNQNFKASSPSYLAQLGNVFIKASGKAVNLTNSSLFEGFYNKPSIKYLSAGGTASKPSYISSKNFSKTLMDVLQDIFVQLEAEKNAPNTKSLLEKIQIGIAQLPANSDTKKHLESLLSDSQNDLEKFKLLLEQWFNETRERAAGWFKRRTQYYLFVIGFILAFSFNANTVTIIKELANDPEARAQLVEMASNYTKDNKELIEEINQLKTEDLNQDDSAKVKQATELVSANIKSLQDITSQLQEDIDDAHIVISDKWETNSFWGKFCHVFSFRHIWGYILTALAISLGSPFWFDLLNKLITLRNSIQPKKETNEITGNNPGATPKRVG